MWERENAIDRKKEETTKDESKEETNTETKNMPVTRSLWMMMSVAIETDRHL